MDTKKKNLRKKKRNAPYEEPEFDEETSGSETMEETTSSNSIKKSKAADTTLGDLHSELSSLPLGELLSLKDHMPAKLYKKAVYDSLKGNDEIADEAKPEKTSRKRIMAEEDDNEEVKMKTFKRDNRKRPREMSAKKPVSVIREIFVTKKREVRDPRFGGPSGEFDQHTFRREYGFLDDMRKEEYQTLKKQIKEEADPEQLQKLRLLKQRMENQRRSDQEEEHKKKLKREVRVANMERLKQGKDLFYVKKSELKRRLQDERLEKLEKAGKLKKYQERREKKLAKKDRL